MIMTVMLFIKIMIMILLLNLVFFFMGDANAVNWLSTQQVQARKN